MDLKRNGEGVINIFRTKGGNRNLESHNENIPDGSVLE